MTMHSCIERSNDLGGDTAFDELVCRVVGRLEEGEPVDLTALAAQSPEFGERLAQLLPTLEAMVELGRAASPECGSRNAECGMKPSLSDSAFPIPHSPFPPDGGPMPGVLGDFRIMREIGRGGMGVVYEAEQLSLGRRVALKVLPFAAMLGELQLKRFKNEARAAATLKHPHIVSVYSVGCDRGVHYYAMELVEGQSLDRVLLQIRNKSVVSGQLSVAKTADQPATDNGQWTTDTQPIAALSTKGSTDSPEYFRSIARLGIEAAEALHHAHEQGIIHRDIKPANLLLDQSGKLWITDFGLARIEADAGLTMTGDMLGTLRYMSPEQALGLGVVDHRTDVYALGVTLYEFLALQPAHAAKGQKQLLQQIASEELRPPRQVKRAVPLDLDTIICKATAKEASLRYASAKELADDLQRFSSDQPIRARRLSFADRLGRWSRRRQGFLASLGAALAVLSAVLALSTYSVKRAHVRAVKALDESRESASRLADLLYVTDMTLAYQVWEKGWSHEVRTILDRHRPEPGGVDRRGLEWRLLNNLTRKPKPLVLTGHNGSVNEIAPFSDGRRLASVGDDGTLRIWDSRSGKLLTTIRTGDAALYSVAVSRCGRFVAAGSKVIYLCDLQEGSIVKGLFRSDHNIESLAFTPDSKGLVAGVRYEEVCLLALDGTVVRRVPCSSRVESLEFTPSGHALLVPARDETVPVEMVQVWTNDLTKVDRQIAAPHLHGVMPTVARSSPCERYLAIGERYPARVIIAGSSSGNHLAQTPRYRDRLNDVSYSPDGSAVVCVYEDGAAQQFELHSAGENGVWLDDRITTFEAHQGSAHCVRFLTSNTLATCGKDGRIKVWDLRQARLERSLQLGSRSLHVNLSPDGSLLLVVCESELLVVDSQTGELRIRRPHSLSHAARAAWSRSGRRIAFCTNASEEATVMDPDGQVICSIPHGSAPRNVALSPDDRMVAIAGDASLQLCSADDGRLIDERRLPGSVLTVAFSPISGRLAYGGRFGEIVLSAEDSTRPSRRLPCASDATCTAFSRDEKLLVTGHADGNIRFWDVRAGGLRGELVGHERWVECVAISPDGRTVVSSSGDATIRLGSVDGARSYGIAFRRAPPMSVSADGRRLAVAYDDQRPGRPDVLICDIASKD